MTASAGKWMEHLRVIMLRETGQSHKTSSRHFPSCAEAMTETGEREQERMRLGCTKLCREQKTDNWRCGRGGARKKREMSNRQDKYY